MNVACADLPKGQQLAGWLEQMETGKFKTAELFWQYQKQTTNMLYGPSAMNKYTNDTASQVSVERIIYYRKCKHKNICIILMTSSTL